MNVHQFCITMYYLAKSYMCNNYCSSLAMQVLCMCTRMLLSIVIVLLSNFMFMKSTCDTTGKREDSM